MTGAAQREESTGRDAYWRLADELRGRAHRPSVRDLLEEGRRRGLKRPHWGDLHELMKLDRYSGIFSLPPYAADFLQLYLKGRTIGRVLDPSAGCGELVGPLVQGGAASDAVAWTANSDALDIGTYLTEDLPVEWHQGDFLKADSGQLFDLVVSAPPLGLPPGDLESSAPDRAPIEARDSQTSLLILKACMSLVESGECLAFLPHGFVNTKPSSAWHLLARLGLSVHAVVEMPDDMFAPWTRIPVSLFAIRRGAFKDRFIGKVVAPDQIGAVCEHLLARKNGRKLEHGRITSEPQLTSWGGLELAERLAGARPKGNLQEATLEELALVINLAARNADEPFVDQTNAIYVPLIGKQPVVTRAADLRIKPHNYAQVVLDPDRAYAAYVAGYFNSEYGRAVRNSALSGAFIPKINKATLARASVLLPTMKMQSAMVDTYHALHSMLFELQEKEETFWANPTTFAAVSIYVKKLESSRSQSSFEEWVETLPFPLASILWRYHANDDARYKTDHLLSFFEATAEFIACALLSGFRHDPELFEQNRVRWLNEGDGSSLRRSTFGYWVVTGERVAKDLRRLLSGNEEENSARAQTAFRTNDRRFLELLAGKEMFRIIRSAADYRNKWAHAGAHSADNYTKLLVNLEGLLTEMRSAVSSSFDGWVLIRPGDCRFRNGVYQYQAAMLKGSRPVFVKKRIDMLEPLNDEHIYLKDTQSSRAIELLPFIKMRRSPSHAEDACYFYNRVDGTRIRWLSYHYEPEDEMFDEDPALISVLTELRRTGCRGTDE